MRYQYLAALSVLLLAACGGSAQTTVHIDASDIFAKSHQALSAADATVDSFELSLTAADIPQQIIRTLTPQNPTFDAILPSGTARHFTVIGYHDTGDTQVPILFGEVILDLAARATIDLVIPVYPAGEIHGNMTIVGGSSALPNTVPLTFKFTATPPDSLPQAFDVLVTQGTYSRVIPVGNYTLSAAFTANGKNYTLLQSSTRIVTPVQGELTEVPLQMIPPNYCNPAEGITPDADDDGSACDMDCNDGDPTLNLLDLDKDGFVTCPTTASQSGDDCDDDDSYRTPNDNDGDGLSACSTTADCDDNPATGKSCSSTCALYYQDKDGDTFGNKRITTEACALPTDYVLNKDDCNDDNAFCDLSCTDLDGDARCGSHDCDDSTTTGATCFTNCNQMFKDVDGDGAGDAATVIASCAPLPLIAGYLRDGTDCNDSDVECKVDCSDKDYDGYCADVDCDDSSRTGYKCHAGCNFYARDADGDGGGSTTDGRNACSRPTGYVKNTIDCDDTNKNCLLSCNDHDKDTYCSDHDCNDSLSTCSASCTDNDGDNKPDCADLCVDQDRDGYGYTDIAISNCTTDGTQKNCVIGLACTNACTSGNCETDCMEGVSTCTSDCTSDADSDGRPDCADLCTDKDRDSYGTNNSAASGCTTNGTTACSAAVASITGTACAGADCDDTSARVNAGATEVPGNNTDENCNNKISCYTDHDQDGFGSFLDASTSDNLSTTTTCQNQTSSMSSNNFDCNDYSASTIHLSGSGSTYSDTTTFGAISTDTDGDGYTACEDECPTKANTPYTTPSSVTISWQRCGNGGSSYALTINSSTVGAQAVGQNLCSSGSGSSELKSYSSTSESALISSFWRTTSLNQATITVTGSEANGGSERLAWFKATFVYSAGSFTRCIYDASRSLDDPAACTSSGATFCAGTACPTSITVAIPNPQVALPACSSTTSSLTTDSTTSTTTTHLTF
jgi:hypothetical protein